MQTEWVHGPSGVSAEDSPTPIIDHYQKLLVIWLNTSP